MTDAEIAVREAAVQPVRVGSLLRDSAQVSHENAGENQGEERERGVKLGKQTEWQL